MPITILDFQNKILGKIKDKIIVIEKKKSDHYRYQLWYNNKMILQTHCSLGSSGTEINDDILGKIKRQLKLDNLNQIYELKRCPMTTENYFNLLKQKGYLA